MFKLRRYLLYVFQSYECTDLGRVLWRELGHNHTNCHPVPIHRTSGCFSGQTWDLDHHPALHLCRHVCLGEGRVPANTLNWSMHTHQYRSTLHTYSQSSINTHPPTHPPIQQSDTERTGCISKTATVDFLQHKLMYCTRCGHTQQHFCTHCAAHTLVAVWRTALS